MWLTKIKVTAATMLSVVVMGTGGALTYRTVAAGTGDEPAGTSQAKKPEAPARPDNQVKENADIHLLKAHNEQLRAKVKKLELEIAGLKADKAVLGAFLGETTVQVFDATKQKLGVETTPPPRVNRTVPDAVVESAQNEVELLKAQLEQKHAAVVGAVASRDFAKRQHARYEELGKTNSVDVRLVDQMTEKLNKANADYDVAAASFKMTQIQLQQAERRLARLQGQTMPARSPAPTDSVQQLRHIETQLESLRQQTEQLRHQLEKAPVPPATRPSVIK